MMPIFYSAFRRVTRPKNVPLHDLAGAIASSIPGPWGAIRKLQGELDMFRPEIHVEIDYAHIHICFVGQNSSGEESVATIARAVQGLTIRSLLSPEPSAQ